jgi:phosphohistidine phosphatase
VITERRLVILRHAKSDWPDGVPDLERPVGERGLREAPLAGRWLRDSVPAIDIVICSPALRARQTCSLALAGLGYDPAVRFDDRLYGQPTATLVEVIGELPPEATTALFVGHNPELSQLVGVLIGTQVELKTSSIAVVTFNSEWASVEPGTGELADLATPR